ncbi:MAG: chemotaxis protein CheW [Nitrospinae bacterium]|jgi:purine-binding chemotaxis protein CheW|nr:chemotaxis protein CheW [Nitrospinota bacterium]
MAESKQFCTFYLGDLFFGVKVENVQEVFRYQDMTKVPLAPSAVRGLINLRGQIITAIDLRSRLGMEEWKEDKLPMNVVVRTEGGVVSLLVDEIADVLEVAEENFERPPDTIDEITRELVLGVYKLKDKLLLILDTKKTVHVGPAESLVATH